jgi:transposase
MARYFITDEIWSQLEATLRFHGCHRWKNDRNVMEAILWKLRTGAPWRDVPPEFCPWKTAYNRFNRWAAKGLWDAFFLRYEEKLTRNGYSPTEAMFGLISMQVELGVVKEEQLADLAEALPPRYTFAPIRMEIRSILKSLGVKFTIRK